MFPPVFDVCAQSAEVGALLGTAPLRMWPFGDAPQTNQTLPYAVWQTVGGAPENYISGVPDIDAYLIQIDVYATTASSARDVARALRDAIEPNAHIISWRGESVEPETRHYRSSFDVDWFNRRNRV